MQNQMHLLKLFFFFAIIVGISACRGANLSPTQGSSLASQTAAIPTTQPATETPTTTITTTSTATITPVLPTPTPTPISYGPIDFPANVNPLTGLTVSQEEILDRRPIAVKVNLVPRTTYRPTWGLSLADIVWEYYHNDGYSRLHVIFYGKDAELAGAIRSGRMPDHDLVQMYKSIFTYGSADALINFRLLNASYSNRLVLESGRSSCPPTAKNPLCRIEPQGSDLLLTGTSELSQYIRAQGVDDSRQNLDGMTFHSTPPEGGEPANSAVIRYSIDNYGKWEYDPDTESYGLAMDGKLAYKADEESYIPLMDRVTDQQITASNIVILVVRHQYYQPPPNEIIEILLSGTGKAYALRDGKVSEVVWNRPTINSVLFLTYPDGQPYAYKPGNTWYHVVGETAQINQVDEGNWRFEFRFP
jgi:hypothetical protein